MDFLSAPTAKEILQALEKGENEIEVSLDLGITTSQINTSEWKDSVESLEKIAADADSLYFWRENGFFKAAISDAHFYKLMPVEGSKAPALLIDGVLMHRVKDTNPLEDAKMKANLCAKRGIAMIEICTGLGYATTACLERGINSIITIEKDSNVLKLAEINPWSQKLFNDDRVKLIEGDATEVIRQMKDNNFHSAIHDPPRLSMGSELYTLEFYSELYRVLKPGGVLFHYVGSPGKKYKKKDIPKGVMLRLRKAGFKDVSRKEDTLGVLARKV
ncbi:MAG: class I SAM-dependent methyltransferase [Candidatus Thorarchaeota archaeon]